jgi:hypothetical protein
MRLLVHITHLSEHLWHQYGVHRNQNANGFQIHGRKLHFLIVREMQIEAKWRHTCHLPGWQESKGATRHPASEVVGDSRWRHCQILQFPPWVKTYRLQTHLPSPATTQSQRYIGKRTKNCILQTSRYGAVCDSGGPSLGELNKTGLPGGVQSPQHSTVCSPKWNSQVLGPKSSSIRRERYKLKHQRGCTETLQLYLNQKYWCELMMDSSLVKEVMIIITSHICPQRRLRGNDLPSSNHPVSSRL